MRKKDHEDRLKLLRQTFNETNREIYESSKKEKMKNEKYIKKEKGKELASKQRKK